MTVNRKKLIQDLESVKKGLATKDLIEQSTSFIFKDGKVLTYNDEIFAMTETELDIVGAIEADPLLKLLHKVKDDELKIEQDDKELKIKGKRFSSGIAVDTDIRIPIDEIELPSKLSKLEDDFSNAAKLACLTASTSLHEPLLTCVHIYNNKIESCDNDRITICTLEQEFDFDILVPAKNLLEICKENLTKIYADDSWIHFKTDDDVFLSTRLYNESYVDLEQFIPKDKGKVIKFPKDTQEIIDRADIFSKDITSQEKVLYVQINNKKFQIITHNNQGWFKERAKIDFDAELYFSLNTEFLKDVLKITNEISIVENSLFFQTENSLHLIQLDNEETPF